MTTPAREALRQAARDLLDAEKGAARIAARFTHAMHVESAATVDDDAGNPPALDPAIVEALAGLRIHAEPVQIILSAHAAAMVVGMIAARGHDDARRIADAVRSGEAAARRDRLDDQVQQGLDAALHATPKAGDA
jgi:hypothetical protein